MSNDIHPKSTDPLPEDIAAKAGMPRASDVEHSLHEIRNEILERATPPGGARDPYDDVRETVGSTGHRTVDDAVGRVSDLSDRAGRAADDVRERIRDGYDDARSWASRRYDDQRRRASALADRGYDRYAQGRETASDFVAENPLIVGVVGLAAGLLLGALLPRTRPEERALGPWAEEAREHGLRYAREATLQGRRFVERTLDPDNLDAAVRRSGAGDEEPYEGSERTAHRL